MKKSKRRFPLFKISPFSIGVVLLAPSAVLGIMMALNNYQLVTVFDICCAAFFWLVTQILAFAYLQMHMPRDHNA